MGRRTAKVHPKVAEVLEAYYQQKAQEEAEWKARLREKHRAWLEKACKTWPRLQELLDAGALTFDEDTGVLTGEGLAPIQIRARKGDVRFGVLLLPGRWSDVDGEWDFLTSTENLEEALVWAREALEGREEEGEAKDAPGICPLFSAGQEEIHHCVGEDCMWWTKSPEVGDSCALWVMAELMTTMARWGLGWAEEEYRENVMHKAMEAMDE